MLKRLLCFMLLLILVLCTTLVYADTNDYCSGYWYGGADDLDIRVSSSADSSTYNLISSGRLLWNGINSNVHMGSIRKSSVPGSEEIYINVCPLVGAYGICKNYQNSYYTWNGAWTYSMITLESDTSEYSDYVYRKKVAVHELGHSIGLTDISSNDSSHANIDLVMKQGDHNFYSPKQHDKDNINAKY